MAEEILNFFKNAAIKTVTWKNSKKEHGWNKTVHVALDSELLSRKKLQLLITKEQTD